MHLSVPQPQSSYTPRRLRPARPPVCQAQSSKTHMPTYAQLRPGRTRPRRRAAFAAFGSASRDRHEATNWPGDRLRLAPRDGSPGGGGGGSESRRRLPSSLCCRAGRGDRGQLPTGAQIYRATTSVAAAAAAAIVSAFGGLKLPTVRAPGGVQESGSSRDEPLVRSAGTAPTIESETARLNCSTGSRQPAV